MLAEQAAAQRVDDWIDRLARAFADQRNYTKALPLAEEANCACPDDPNILLFAATAALFAGKPDRAKSLLKLFDNRATAPAAELLRALALHMGGNTSAAKILLHRQKMTRWSDVLGAFPRGIGQARWLKMHFGMILEAGAERPSGKLAPAAGKPIAKADKAPQDRGGTPASASRSAAAVALQRATAPAPTPEPAPAVGPLPLIPIDLSFDLDFDASRLQAALVAAVSDERHRTRADLDSDDTDGRWFRLLKPGIFKTPKDFRAVHVTPGKPRVPANPDALRALIRDAMIRNTRAIVALKLPRRQASMLKIEPTADERAAYAALTAAARDLATQDASGHHRLILHHLLVAAGSSPSTAAASALRMAERNPNDKVWTILAKQ